LINYKTYFFESLSSTNDTAFELLKNENDPLVVVAKTQTKGRGRFDRVWHGQKDKSIFISFASEINSDFKLQFFSLVAGVKLCNFLHNEKISIKWPNDIYYDSRKLAGILCECQIFKNKRLLVAGLGVNFKKIDSMPATKTSPAFIDEFYDCSYAKILEICSKALSETYESIMENKFVDDIKNFAKYDFLFNKEISATNNGEKISGKALGIDENAQLTIQQKDSSLAQINSGEATLS